MDSSQTTEVSYIVNLKMNKRFDKCAMGSFYGTYRSDADGFFTNNWGKLHR